MIVVSEREFTQAYNLGREGGPAVRPKPGWVYIHHGMVPDRADRQTLRLSLVRVSCSNGRAIHRRLRWGPSLRTGADGGPAQIGLDWDSWLELNPEADENQLTLKIDSSRSILAWFGVRHPEPTVHAAALLGVVGVVLGAIGLVLGILSLI